MTTKTISQKGARRLRRRVAELERILDQQSFRWAHDWPGGVNFWTLVNFSGETMAAFRTARALGHAIVAVPGGSAAQPEVRFYALPVPKVPS